jgi:hypothetical protein
LNTLSLPVVAARDTVQQEAVEQADSVLVLDLL